MNKLHCSIVALLILLALFVRAYDLSTHFAHGDDLCVAVDILKARVELQKSMQELRSANIETSPPATGREKLWRTWVINGPRFTDPITLRIASALAVPTNQTYAPLQFILTSFLLSPDHSYRQSLFWGRLPSLLFGMLSFLWLALFFRVAFGKDNFPYQIIVFGILAFSWEAIIYSKQMPSYAIGLFSMSATLFLLTYFAQRKSMSLTQSFALGALLALLCYAQYETIALIPAFYGTLWWMWYRVKAFPWREVLARIVMSGFAFALFSLPLYFIFLKHRLGHGTNRWNVGPNGEYLFHLQPGMTLLDKLVYPFKFFINNSFEVIQSNHSFVPPDSLLFLPISGVFALLMAIGLWRLMRPDSQRRYLGLFILITGLTWAMIVLRGSLTLGPTRHALILLPLSAILIAVGLEYLASLLTPVLNRRGYRRPLFPVLAGGLVAIQATLFFYWFPSVVASRKDPFIPSEIATTLKNYDVKLLVPSYWTLNLDLMKNELPPLERGAVFSFGDRTELSKRLKHFVGNFAWISFRSMPPDIFLKAYKVVVSQRIPSNTEVDFLNRTHNGTNGFYFYVFENGAQTLNPLSDEKTFVR